MPQPTTHASRIAVPFGAGKGSLCLRQRRARPAFEGGGTGCCCACIASPSRPSLRARASSSSSASAGQIPMTKTSVFELESQQEEAMTPTTTRVAAENDVRTSAALRLLAFAASLAAALVVVTNRQERWGVTVTFSMFDVWTAFVATSFFVAAYTLLTAIFVKDVVRSSWVHHTDLVIVNLMTAATAGAGAIGSVAMRGNKPSGWYPVCHLYRLYCNKGAVSLVLAFVAILALGFCAGLSRCYPRAPPPTNLRATRPVESSAI